jgi:molybdate transport system substrate-binding protein
VKSRIAIGIAAVTLLAQTGLVAAAEIKVLCTEALRPVFDDLARDFERTSGDHVAVSYATAGVLANRIRGGERVDVIVLTRSLFAPLAKEARIAGEGPTRLARSPLAFAVRAGAPKPDISTVEAVRRTLLAAKSITYSDPTRGGGIGVQAARVIERLGLTDELKSKTIVTPAGEFRDVLAKGGAELAVVLPIVIVNNREIDLVGVLPGELQVGADFDFMVGVDAQAAEPAGATALIRHLLSPAAAAALKAKGLEPG